MFGCHEIAGAATQHVMDTLLTGRISNLDLLTMAIGLQIFGH